MPRKVASKRAVAKRSAKQPAAKKSAAKQPAARKPAKQPAVKKSAAKPAVKKAAKQPAVRKQAKQPAATKVTPKPRGAAKRTTAAKPAATSPAEATLWAIVSRVREVSGGELQPALDAFRAELDQLDDDALVRVEAAFCAAMRRAYDWNVWGAAYVIHGGCSDDTFWDFRAGLIALGREVYEAALRDPETLVGIDDVENATLMEGFQYVPGQLLEERELDSVGGGHSRGAPTGKMWTENVLPERYPKLVARFP